MHDMMRTKRHTTPQRGATALLSIVFLALLALGVGIGILGVSSGENFASSNARKSDRALLYAEAGVREALVRITRNKAYSCASPALPAGCFSLEFVPNGCANNKGCVRVTVDAGTGASGDLKTVRAQGRVDDIYRTLQAEVEYDTALRGEISTTTWTEL